MPTQSVKAFGPYRLHSVIGRTRTATVYKALDEHRRQVAVKILFKDTAANPEYRRRFLQTAQMAAGIRHPGIVPVVDYGELGGHLYLAMPFVRGQSLERTLSKRSRLPWRQRSRLPWPRAVMIVSHVAGALAYLHEQNIVHGDVKPSNIMFGAGGRALLTDLGIAGARGTRFSTSSAFALGSAAYMPPEQIVGRPVDGRGDQYALATVLYEMLAGWRPFGGDDIAVVLRQQVGEAAPPLVVRGLPPALPLVIMRALAKRPDDRFDSVDEFAQALWHSTSDARKLNQAVVMVAGVSLALLLVSLVVAWSMWVK
ncbi:MAG: serine/threonine protein kinase [Chloroflexi bacterium]|nr:serine/threonine protein kinase [Chloroflexota bacterium]